VPAADSGASPAATGSIGVGAEFGATSRGASGRSRASLKGQRDLLDAQLRRLAESELELAELLKELAETREAMASIRAVIEEAGRNDDEVVCPPARRSLRFSGT
jgi:hypothetical protein